MSGLSDEKKRELFEAFHSDAIEGEVFKRAREEKRKLSLIKLFYDTDDIFRREIDHLRKKMEKKEVKAGAVEEKITELLREAEYRRYIASFVNMEKNFEARKDEMAKVKEAFK